MNSRHLPALLLACAGLIGRPAAAQTDACLALPRAEPAAAAATAGSAEGPVKIDADTAQYERPLNRYHLQGNVELQRGEQFLRADEMYYHAGREQVDLLGEVGYRSGGLSLNARQGHVQLDSNEGELLDVGFQLPPGTAHGEAERVELLDRERARLKEVTYTTCAPGDEDWWIRADRLSLDRESGLGTARNASLRFFGVPLLYTPYISFPIDDRRMTGLLAPRLKFSGDDGFDYTQPIYWNIAPNYDATFTPRLIQERGLMLGGEARLLKESYSTGTELLYLPDDQQFGDDRWLAHWQAQSLWSGPWQAYANLNRVSDGLYFNDFGDSLSASAATHLLSEASARYSQRNWSLQARTLSWQTLDEAIAPIDEPYRLLPGVHLNYLSNPGEDGWVYSFDADASRFDHRHADLKDTGLRFDVAPRLSYRLQHLAYFLTPSVTVRHTSYQLDRPDPLAPDSPSRTLPLVSLDSGLFLERELTLFDRALTQTLEPRLFYLYVPRRDQSDLPLFDTALAEFTLTQIFQENRFVGVDRIADANQVTAALGTRFIDRDSGREYLYAAAGQIFYLDEPSAQLGGIPGRHHSDLLLELRGEIGPVGLFAEYQWDPYDNRGQKTGLRLNYRPDEQRAFNLAYRQRTADAAGEELEQIAAAAVWPIRAGWQGVAGWQYSLLHSTTLERFAGVAYTSCCWSLRVVGREQIDVADREPSRSVLLQLEFTGLGALGESVDEIFRDSAAGATLLD